MKRIRLKAHHTPSGYPFLNDAGSYTGHYLVYATNRRLWRCDGLMHHVNAFASQWKMYGNKGVIDGTCARWAVQNTFLLYALDEK